VPLSAHDSARAERVAAAARNSRSRMPAITAELETRGRGRGHGILRGRGRSGLDLAASRNAPSNFRVAASSSMHQPLSPAAFNPRHLLTSGAHSAAAVGGSPHSSGSQLIQSSQSSQQVSAR
jgi:hypothetical protein